MGVVFKDQTELIKSMDVRTLIINLYLTQGIILIIAILLGIILFENLEEFLNLWKLRLNEVLFYGAGSACIILIIDCMLTWFLPRKMVDDGGINEKIFRNISVPHAFIICVIVAFSEEILFRGIIQTHVGYIAASIIFALIHYRYIFKWVLLVAVILVSFFLGWIFYLTNNLMVTFLAHFLIDFTLALLLRFNFFKHHVQ